MEYNISLLLIRHGETASNKEHRYLGQTEESLSEKGIEQLMRNKELNRYPSIDVLFTSPMKRCLETAELLYPEKKACVIEKWREMNFGAFEGKNYLELKEDARYQAWIDSNGTIAFPNGESQEEFVSRTVQGMDELQRHLKQIKEEHQPMPRKIGLIVHGGTIMALLSHYYGGAYFDYQVNNGAGYQCKCVLSEESIEMIEIEKLPV